MSDPGRDAALAAAAGYFDQGGFVSDLAQRIAVPTESNPPNAEALRAYLREEIGPQLDRLGVVWRIVENPAGHAAPFLIGERREGDDLPTLLTYGHGDTVPAMSERWSPGRDPWTLSVEGERIYGRGTADNKGQHTIVLAALETVLAERGRLGFNLRVLIDMCEEAGSVGLRDLVGTEAEALRADLLIASDGPRTDPARPCLVLGTRGTVNFRLTCAPRESGHHSGNWGGLIVNPATRLAHALTALVSAKGEIRVAGLRPPALDPASRAALAGVEPGGGPDAPAIDRDWGEPGLTPAERVYAWNALEVLALDAGDAARPVNAIPPRAEAVIQMRFIADSDADGFAPAIRAALDEAGFADIELNPADRIKFAASRTPPDHPWVEFAIRSCAATLGDAPMIIPSAGGSLPNDLFTELLGMPAIWVPHSYAGCQQHAPDEHLLAPLAREGLQIMTGLFWDLGGMDTGG